MGREDEDENEDEEEARRQFGISAAISHLNPL
jgi:hypothetical protein